MLSHWITFPPTHPSNWILCEVELNYVLNLFQYYLHKQTHTHTIRSMWTVRFGKKTVARTLYSLLMSSIESPLFYKKVPSFSITCNHLRMVIYLVLTEWCSEVRASFDCAIVFTNFKGKQISCVYLLFICLFFWKLYSHCFVLFFVCLYWTLSERVVYFSLLCVNVKYKILLPTCKQWKRLTTNCKDCGTLNGIYLYILFTKNRIVNLGLPISHLKSIDICISLVGNWEWNRFMVR